METHFESGGRTDAVLRNNRNEAVAALEWEWSALHRGDAVVTEFEKLRKGCSVKGFEGLRFACLIGYARKSIVSGREDYTARSASVLEGYTRRWPGELPPLLLVVVHFVREGKAQGRRFLTTTLDELCKGSVRRLREQPAYPWDVSGSRWAQESKHQVVA